MEHLSGHLVIKTQNPDANTQPRSKIRSMYQDLHGLSQSLDHLLIVFILLLRLCQQSRQLSHPGEKSGVNTVIWADGGCGQGYSVAHSCPNMDTPLQPPQNPWGAPAPQYSLQST